MSLLEIHEPGETPLPHAGEASLAVGIDLGTTNSVVAIAREDLQKGLADLSRLFQANDKPAIRTALLRLRYLDKFADEAKARRTNLEKAKP